MRAVRPTPLLLLVTVVLVALALLRPVDHDESQYVAAAMLMADGWLPYRDYAYLQTPLQPFAFAPLLWVFGAFAWPALLIANALLGVTTIAAGWRVMREGGVAPGVATVSAALFAAGLHESQPTAVTFHPAAADGKEPAFVSLAYPDGVTVHVNRPQRLRTEGPAVTHERAIRIAGDGGGRAARPVPVYRGGSIYADFIEGAKTRERPFRDLEPAVNTMVALHLAGLAFRLQRSLTWDRVTQRFPGDEDANRFLDRARREPWIL